MCPRKRPFIELLENILFYCSFLTAEQYNFLCSQFYKLERIKGDVFKCNVTTYLRTDLYFFIELYSEE